MRREGSHGGGGGAMAKGVLKKVLLSYSYVAIWIFLSFTVIVYSKYILDLKLYGWPFPISLTLIHMSFCSALAFFLIRVLRLVALPSSPAMTLPLYLSSVLPIGALYSLSLWFSNSAYIYLSVSFIQMLKALMPVTVYSISILFKKESFKPSSLLNMLSISLGGVVTIYGEARLILIQILLSSKGISLNPITSLYYVAPCCLTAASFHRDLDTASFLPWSLIFTTNSFCAFVLSLAVFLLVGKTSTLTMNVVGIIKDGLLIAGTFKLLSH